MGNPDDHREEVLRAAFELRTELLAYARSLLGNYAVAEDVVQEAFLVVVKKHDKFQDGTSLLAWCRAIVRIEVLKAQDRFHRDRSLIERVLDDSIDAAFAEFQQSRSQLEADQRKDALVGCVKKLSERAQSVLSARMADELGYPQISERLGMSIEAVRKSLFRAKKLVRECVETQMNAVE